MKIATLKNGYEIESLSIRELHTFLGKMIEDASRPDGLMSVEQQQALLDQPLVIRIPTPNTPSGRMRAPKYATVRYVHDMGGFRNSERYLTSVLAAGDLLTEKGEKAE